MARKLVDLECTLLHETEKAVKVLNDRTPAEGVWVPKSLCEVERHDRDHYDLPCDCTITLSESLAIDKELV